jgi:hypothetical protein
VSDSQGAFGCPAILYVILTAPQEVAVLGTLVCQAAALVAHKPRETPNDFVSGKLTSVGMKLENARYQNRVRKSNQVSPPEFGLSAQV